MAESVTAGPRDAVRGRARGMAPIPKIGRVSLARENEAGAVGSRRSIFSMLGV